MEKIHLCSCLYCGSVLIDTNPKEDSIPVELDPETIMSFDSLTDFQEGGETLPNGCPNCGTDSYLSDSIPDFLKTKHISNENT